MSKQNKIKHLKRKDAARMLAITDKQNEALDKAGEDGARHFEAECEDQATRQAHGLIPSGAYNIDIVDPSEGHFNCTAKHVIKPIAKALKAGHTFIVKINSCNWLVYDFTNGLKVKFHIGQLSED